MQEHCPGAAAPPLRVTVKYVPRPHAMAGAGLLTVLSSSRAGETLYLPSLWFHQVEQRAGATGLAGLTVAVNYWSGVLYPRPCARAAASRARRVGAQVRHGL